jgi:nicotinamidase/pyrazinamidase
MGVGWSIYLLLKNGLLNINYPINYESGSGIMEIRKFEDSQKALFVIDIQEEYTGDTAKAPFPYKDSVKLITTVNKLIEVASEKNIIIVYIRQEFEHLGKLFSKVFCGGTAIKGNLGTELDKRINIKSNYSFSKAAPDAFSNLKLEEFLNEHKVSELYLVGLDAEYCVYSTAKGALKHGYNVSIITDGIVLKAEKKWNELLKKYEHDGINLISSEEFWLIQ